MKKVFSLVVILLFMSSSFGDSYAAKQEEMSVCATVAHFAGFYSSMNGGNYYEAYFAAYGTCLESIDPF